MLAGVTEAKSSENAVRVNGRKVTDYGKQRANGPFPAIICNQVHSEVKALDVNLLLLQESIREFKLR